MKQYALKITRNTATREIQVHPVTIAPPEAKLPVNVTEVGQAKSRNFAVGGVIATEHGQIAGRFGGFRVGPDDVGGFH